jgi:GDSL-like Lipase/Acylhydrolase
MVMSHFESSMRGGDRRIGIDVQCAKSLGCGLLPLAHVFRALLSMRQVIGTVAGSRGRDSSNDCNPLEIAVIGDSLTTGFFVSSPLGMIWRARTQAHRNWFVDSTRSIRSVEERLRIPVITHQYSTVSATVDNGEERTRTLVDYLLGTRHFSQQIASVTKLARFPDVVLIWIGHNNLDAVRTISTDDPHLGRETLAKLTEDFAVSFRRQIARLVIAAALADHAIAIVVFGLINFRSFFIAREKAESIHLECAARYRRAADDYRYFESLRPQHRAQVIDLASQINTALFEIVQRLSVAEGVPRHVALRYSNAFYDTDISTELAISDVDAWHPSRFGHELLAESAYEAIADVMDFLRAPGWPARTIAANV